MPSFVFWNLKRQSRLDSIRELASRYEADFLMLAECEDESVAVLNALANVAGRRYRCVSQPDDWIKVFTTYDEETVHREVNLLYRRVVIYQVKLPRKDPLLLAALHLMPKVMGVEDEDIYRGARAARQQIELIEHALGTMRTVIVGDFNMTPFHKGMTAADGFHALMDRETVNDGAREVDFVPYTMFYNPMWSLLGDRTKGPPGSFHRLQGLVSHGWHMLDQVILRPAIIDALAFDSLEIVPWPSIATYKGRPNPNVGSDHFPLRFVLNL